MVKQRKSARALLQNDEGETLLIEHVDRTPVDPAHPETLHYWATPGGGLKDGEKHEDALRRELLEELGLHAVEIGRLIALREIVLDLPDQGTLLSQESYFLCKVVGTPQLNPDGMSQNERRVFREARWWSLEDIKSTAACVRPPALPELLRHAASAQREPIVLSA